MKRRKMSAFVLAFVLVLSLLPTNVTFAADFDGSGTESAPYKIVSTASLNTLRQKVNSGTNYQGQYFKLEQSLSVSGWTPIGTESYPFAGTFDGGGYVITLNGTAGGDNQGLFGYISSSGTVKNLSVGGTVSGNENVGGLVGQNLGTIENCDSSCTVTGATAVGGLAGCSAGKVQYCYNTGNVTASVESAGGVVGWDKYESNGYLYGKVLNCYNTGNISGTTMVGGVIGRENAYSNNALIKNCYSTGTVSITNKYNIGGVVGYNLSPVLNCYYLEGCAAEGTNLNNNGTAITAEDMKKRATFSGWDFPTTWYMGSSRPLLVNHIENTDTLMTGKYDLDGDGTKDSVYLLATAEQLIDFGVLVNNGHGKLNAILTADIDLTGRGWTPIGVNYSDFTGIFDGQGHTITGMSFSTVQNGYGGHLTYDLQGLFGVICDSAQVRNFTVHGNITLASGSMEHIGGVVGLAYGEAKIDNVTSYVNITDGGTAYSDIRNVGGIAGRIGNNNKAATPGHINNCKSYGSINIDTAADVGGVVGNAQQGSFITNSTNFGKVGHNYIGHIGGVAGAATTGTHVKNCANYGDVSANCHDCIGGVVGYANEYVTIKNCLNGGTISGQPSSDSNNAGAYIGGILGYINNSNFTALTNCLNYGTIKNTGGTDTYVGALVGWVNSNTNGSVITDNYYLNTSCTKAAGGKTIGTNTAATAQQLASGRVAYSLQGTQEEQVWGQSVSGTVRDDYPSIGGAKVYYGTGCDGVTKYANKAISAAHNYVNGACTNCGIAESISQGEDGTYQIGSAAEYIYFTDVVNKNGAQNTLNAVLTADIDLSGYDYIPIGKEGSEFIGTFDGAGHKIENLTMTADESNMGMFGKTDGATVKNFSVSGDITAVLNSLEHIGGVVGSAQATTISGVNANINLKDNGRIEHIYRAGGIVAKASEGTTIESCTYGGTITLHYGSHTAGIVGAAYDSTKDKPITIQDCVNKANMTFDTSRRVAGILGFNDTYTSVSRCANYGNITITESDGTNQAAGIVACNVHCLTLNDCGNYGNITDGKYNASLGGIVGFVDIYRLLEVESNPTDYGCIKTCFNYGQIINTNENGSTYLGALVGHVKNDEKNQPLKSKIQQNYYLEGSAANAFGTSGLSGTATAVTAEESASGKVARLLRYFYVTWGQTLTGENATPYPIPNGEQVNEVVFKVNGDDYATKYGNASGLGSLPENPFEDFAKWTYTIAPNSEEFTATSPITNYTMHVYAQEKKSYADVTISTVEELKALRDAVNKGETYAGQYVLLTADLDLEGSAENPWKPIGGVENHYGVLIGFKGTFDGDDHKITGLYINDPEADNQGLFGYLNETYNNQSQSGVVKNLSVEGNVTGENYIGGVVGQSMQSTAVINCYYSGSVSGTKYVGGVVGEAYGKVKNCINNATVTSSGSCVGGVVGDSAYHSIENCYNTGSVSGTDNVGGVVGYIGYNGCVINSYNTGSVSGTSYVGGVAGYNGQTSSSNCYNTGSVSGTSDVGGVAGYSRHDITNCYYLSTCAAEGTTFTNKVGTALTVGEMKTKATFNNWDFETVWFMGEAAPLLQATPKKSTRLNPDVKIATVDDLKALRDAFNNGETYAGKYILLTADLNLEGSETNQWTPIGDGDRYFDGTFDGGGHKITGLYINNPTGINQGLFGSVSGTVKNLNVEGSVTGDDSIGGIAGNNNGIIQNCSFAGSVSGTDDIGGVVGWNTSFVKNCYNTATVSGSGYTIGGVVGNSQGPIFGCYNTGSVSGQKKVGGIAGDNNRQIYNSYNTGSVSGAENVGGVAGEFLNGLIENCYNIGSVSGTGEQVGGLVGLKYQLPITNSYYLATCAADGTTLTNTHGTPLSAEAMKDATSFEGWDFETIWQMGVIAPVLKALGESSVIITPDVTISNVEELANLRDAVNGGESYEGQYIMLTADLDLEGSETNQWTPIGNVNQQFKGTFDGDGHTITGLYINAPEANYQGLFGYVAAEGTVKNLGVDGIVQGGSNVGGVVGKNRGTVESCYNKANISGQKYVGGVNGYSDITVKGCYNTGSVSGTYYVGGVVGCNQNNGTIENCYNLGAVSGTYYVSGVVGYNYTGIIKSCYNTGSVSGISYVGGVVGLSSIVPNTTDSSLIQNCYNTGSISGTESVGGVVGDIRSTAVEGCYYLDSCAAEGTTLTNTHGTALTAEAMKTAASFSGWNFTFNWRMGLFSPLLRANPEKHTRNNPDVKISTVDELKTLCNAVNGGESYEGQYILLTADLDLEGSETNPWTPIGSYEQQFKGTFDGDGHKITGLYGLYINSTVTYYQGLFGYVAAEGTVKNLGIDGIVQGQHNVGGVVGRNCGTVENCCFTGSVSGTEYVGGVVGQGYGGTIKNCANYGTVSGTENNLGGVAGKIDEGTLIENCFSVGSVNGMSDNDSTCWRVGGVVGYVGNNSKVINCYNTGAVNAAQANNVGGVVGMCNKTSAIIENCYNAGTVNVNTDTTSSEVFFVGGVIGFSYIETKNSYYLATCAAEGTTFYKNTYSATALTADEMKTSTKFSGWDFDTVWVMGALSPMLRSNPEKNTLNTPQKINSLAEFMAFCDAVNGGETYEGKAFVLTTDLDLGGSAANPWLGIGSQTVPFEGTFDGGGHTITGLYLGVGSGGLFNYVGESGMVQNLGMVGNIGGYATCSLVNANYGTVKNCYNTCNISGGVGGLVSLNGTTGVIENCYNTGNIDGGERIGGIVGQNEGVVKNCYNTGSICGENYVGGIVGYNNYEEGENTTNPNLVTGCYSSGEISNKDSDDIFASAFPNIGEICGWNNYGNVENSEGLTAAKMADASSFSGWDFVNVWVIYGDRPILRTNLEPSDFEIKINGASGSKASATLFIPEAGSYSVMFATYSNGVLTAAEAVSLTVTEQTKGVQTVTTTGDMTLTQNDKIMLWDSLTTLSPKCSAYTVK